MTVHGSVTQGERLAVLYRVVNGLIRTQVVSQLLLAGVLIAAGHAQSAPRQDSSGSSTSVAASATNNSAASARVVLKVGDVQVTQAQFEAMVRDLEEQQGPADLSRKAIGENYSSLLMLSQQATANHMDTSPEVLRQLAIDRTQILSNAEFAKLKAEAQPTPEEINAYYTAHMADYDVVALRRLFIWKKAADSKDGRGMSEQDAQALANAVRQSSASEADAKKLIRDPNSVVLDSDPLTFQHGEMPGKMEKAAFALTKPGEWTVFEDTPTTLVLLQLVKRSRLDLKDVSPQIEKKLQAEKLRAELDELKKKSGIWMDEQYFAAKAPASKTQTQASGPEKQ